MRVAFAGTGDFAVPCLGALARLDVTILAVVTRPDRPQGRGRLPSPTPVAAEASALGFPFCKVDKIRDIEAALRDLDLDAMIVADFGEIIPERILELPRLGSFNVHGSLLPRWRGAAPCAWAVRAGDPTTGVTLFRMVQALDAGPILLQREIPVLPGDTAGTIEARLSAEAVALLGEAIPLLAGGGFSLREQDARRITLAPKLAKDDGVVPWAEDATAIERHVRAMQPWPGAFSFLAAGGRPPVRTGLLKAQAIAGALTGVPSNAAPGTIAAVGATTLEVACGSGRLAVLELQPAGKKGMTAADFLRGNRVAVGDEFRSKV